jgi:hypothetical protein
MVGSLFTKCEALSSITSTTRNDIAVEAEQTREGEVWGADTGIQRETFYY